MEHTIDTQQMNSMKVLAETAMKISEAKGLLFKLQETETEYLDSREKKAMAKIQKLLVDSQDLLDKTKNNHEEIREYAKTVSSFADFLTETYDKFQGMLQNFNERNELWDQNIKRQTEIIADQRRQVESDEKHVREDEIKLKNYKKELEKEKAQIESRQAALIISYETEKNLWNKLNSPKN